METLRRERMQNGRIQNKDPPIKRNGKRGDNKMDYIHANKEAWEDAFAHRLPCWGDTNAETLKNERLPFFCPDIARELQTIGFKNKTVSQFCCNNGRELLSLMQLGAKEGIVLTLRKILSARQSTPRKKRALGIASL